MHLRRLNCGTYDSACNNRSPGRRGRPGDNASDASADEGIAKWVFLNWRINAIQALALRLSSRRCAIRSIVVSTAAGALG
jgi:hypothetical protein